MYAGPHVVCATTILDVYFVISGRPGSHHSGKLCASIQPLVVESRQRAQQVEMIASDSVTSA